MLKNMNSFYHFYGDNDLVKISLVDKQVWLYAKINNKVFKTKLGKMSLSQFQYIKNRLQYDLDNPYWDRLYSWIVDIANNMSANIVTRPEPEELRKYYADDYPDLEDDPDYYE